VTVGYGASPALGLVSVCVERSRSRAAQVAERREELIREYSRFTAEVTRA
jgi:hypothetical protein